MCRLYCLFSSDSTKVECGLVRAQNALLAQSQSDSSGVAHPDGWGIAYYRNGLPTTEHRSAAASEDLRFSETAKGVIARVVVAHIRKATVGRRSKSNAHPFTHGRWTFAHNGTIPSFEKIEPYLLSRTPSELIQMRRGDTDSELAFLWILGQLRSVLPESANGGDQVKPLAETLRLCIDDLVSHCESVSVDAPPALNFVLTDGHRLVVSRWNRSLYWVLRRQRGKCEVCETCHCERCQKTAQQDHGTPYTAVVIASEPITAERWEPVPEAHILAIDDRMTPELIPI